MDSDNPLIRFFKERKDKSFFKDGALVYEQVRRLLNKNVGAKNKESLRKLLYQLEIFAADICIPSYFSSDLLGILLLGKKKSGKRFASDEIDFFVALASDVTMAIKNAQLFKELNLELYKKQRLFIHTTIALAAAIDAKDHYTHGHTTRVTNISMEIARRLIKNRKRIFNKELLEDLNIAALLHDIGKIGVPESILKKEGPLNDEEIKKMQKHTLIGAAILNPIKELKEPILGVKYHHEKYDGTGYPDGLKGDQIPLIASIISVADVFDAMVTDRPYRKALPKEKVKEIIKEESGRHFSPLIAATFIELFQEGKV
jgi:putative nucleotidyltransferase with HDIG domain